MNTAVVRENWVGQLVDGTFPLLNWLGGSQRSPVYRTQLPGPQEQAAAIKLIPANSTSAERQVSQWQRTAALNHPHVLRVLHGGRWQINNAPLLYVVMEFAEEDLSQVLPARALSPQEARETLLPLIDALSYLHEKGLVHGRIKASNVMAVGDQLKLSSDSIRAAAETGAEALAPGSLAAPEVATGSLSPAADIWAVGAMLVQCLSPRPEIRDGSRAITAADAETLPEPFRRITRGCLQRDPNARCSLADIRNWLRPATASVAATQATNTTRPRSRLVPALFAAAIVVLLAIFIARWAMRGKSEDSAQTAQPQPAAGTVSTEPSAPASDSVTAPTTGAAQGAVAERVLPDVSASARNTIQGKIRVSVRVVVNSSGEVTGASLTSAGPSRYFANKALEAARRWKFTPAQVNGRPAPSQWTLRFLFGRAGTEVVPTPSQVGSR